MSCENGDIVFGQEFLDKEDGTRRVIVDPEQKRTVSGLSIGAAQVGCDEINGQQIEFLGLSSTINLKYIGEVVDHWSLERIKTAHSKLYPNNVLGEALEELFDSYSKKPPSKRDI